MIVSKNLSKTEKFKFLLRALTKRSPKIKYNLVVFDIYTFRWKLLKNTLICIFHNISFGKHIFYANIINGCHTHHQEYLFIEEKIVM